MARTPEPWWRKDREAWFVTIKGKRHNLGADKEAAFRRFHQLMAVEEPQDAPASDLVLVVFDRFLDWTQRHRAERTYELYRLRCQSFADTLPPGSETSTSTVPTS